MTEPDDDAKAPDLIFIEVGGRRVAYVRVDPMPSGVAAAFRDPPEPPCAMHSEITNTFKWLRQLVRQYVENR